MGIGKAAFLSHSLEIPNLLLVKNPLVLMNPSVIPLLTVTASKLSICLVGVANSVEWDSPENIRQVKNRVAHMLATVGQDELLCNVSASSLVVRWARLWMLPVPESV